MDPAPTPPRIRALDESRFCAAWVEHRNAAPLRWAFRLTIGVHLGSLALLPLFVHPSTLHALLGLHGGILAFLALGFVFRTLTAKKVLMVGNAVALNAGYLTLLYYTDAVLHSPRDVLLASIGVVAYSAATIQLFPWRGIGLYLFGLSVAAGAAVAGWQAPGGPIWGSIFAIMTAWFLAVRYVMDRRLLRAARSEYRFRSQIVPSHILRHATGDTEDLQRAFLPETKECVCISSDWRNYQELSASLSSAQLAATLNAYYDLCHRLLDEHLPAGNYFTDWIADELFVVLFAVEGSSESLVDAALFFSSALLTAKKAFLAHHGLPRAIDVGVAGGEALLGLMGPEGLRKATALGEIPGRARRIQTAAKLLRKAYGDADRVVFGQECLMRVTKPFPVQVHELGGDEAVRDLKDRELFFLEPSGSQGNGYAVDSDHAQDPPLRRLAVHQRP